MSHESLNCDKKGKYSVQVAEADVFTPEEKLHVCEECGSSFLDRKKLSQHARRVHRRALNLTCKRCPFRTSEEQSLEAHSKWHARLRLKRGSGDDLETALHKCDRCDYASRHLYMVRIHVKTVHEGARDHVCEECGKRFSRLQNCKTHMRAVHSRKRSPDDDDIGPSCGKGFSKRRDLERHEKSSHLRIKDHACDRCPFVTSDADNLRRHANNMHSEGRRSQFLCEICSGTFTTGKDLKRHVARIHLKRRDNVCPVSTCGYAAFSKTDLRSHQRNIHERKREYKCELCQRSFRGEGTLSNHVRARHPEQERQQESDKTTETSLPLHPMKTENGGN